MTSERKDRNFGVFNKNTTKRQKSLANADSGCLGMKYRRRTLKAAIFVEEEPKSFDPTVSEWENPVWFTPGYLHSKFLNLFKILKCRRKPPELKHLSKVRKRN